MKSAAARADRIPDWQLVVVGRVRAIENAYRATHERLLNWGRWGRNEREGNPDIATSGIYRLPGEYDPELDAEAAPEVPMVPIDNMDAEKMDRAISSVDFVALWRKVLKANYVLHLPEWQRPRAAGIANTDDYVQQLSLALNALCRTP